MLQVSNVSILQVKGQGTEEPEKDNWFFGFRNFLVQESDIAAEHTIQQDCECMDQLKQVYKLDSLLKQNTRNINLWLRYVCSLKSILELHLLFLIKVT